jgi:starch synthase
MNILLASSEAHPYSKTGGLADMVGALAKFLARAGHEVSLVTPLYDGIRHRFPNIEPFDWQLDLPLGSTRAQGKVWRHQPDERLSVYFIDHPQFFDRTDLYGDKGDNAERFIFFSKAALHLARFLPGGQDIVHAHDWQTGLMPALMLEQKLHGGWSDAPPCCLTIHNLAYQGNFPAEKFLLANLPQTYFQPDGAEFYGTLNCLKAGIAYADLLTTVSPRYAREITTEEFGCGLDGVLRRRQNVLFGVLNGVDYDEWNTDQNRFLKHSYTVKNLQGKQDCKVDLQKEMGLTPRPDVPLFGTISRLAYQKGIDIEVTALQEMLAADMQFVFLGSGDREYERAWRKLAQRLPGKCAAKIGFDTGLSHRIEAGCDFYLMPSRYEPSGLNQMYSLRYGTVPVVRVTGGLDDSVIDIGEDQDKANGIKFNDYSVRALSKAVRKALVLYEDKKLLAHFRRNGMTADFSWERTAAEYSQLYRRLPSVAKIF